MIVHVEKLDPPIHCWWECKMVQPPWKTGGLNIVLKKLNIVLTRSHSSLPLGMYQEKCVHTTIRTDVHNSIVWNSQQV